VEDDDVEDDDVKGGREDDDVENGEEEDVDVGDNDVEQHR
jgi:hypothetical protein